MRHLLFYSILLFSIIFISCTKTKTETVTNTVQVRAVDTSMVMDSKNWNLFSYLTLSLRDSGASTYYTTAEGVRFIGQASRYGSRIQTKTEFGFHGKTLYFKWKGGGGGQFAGFVPQIKYDILSTDGAPQIQGVDLSIFSLPTTTAGSTVIQENTWYYTRVAPVTGTDNYLVTTATGNYSNLGGAVVLTKTLPIYTKSGYLALRIGDTFAGSGSYAILGECKIASN